MDTGAVSSASPVVLTASTTDNQQRLVDYTAKELVQHGVTEPLARQYFGASARNGVEVPAAARSLTARLKELAPARTLPLIRGMLSTYRNSLPETRPPGDTFESTPGRTRMGPQQNKGEVVIPPPGRGVSVRLSAFRAEGSAPVAGTDRRSK